MFMLLPTHRMRFHIAYRTIHHRSIFFLFPFPPERCHTRFFHCRPAFSILHTVISELKKGSTLNCGNQRVLNLLDPEKVSVVIRLADEAEADEMWSFVGRKKRSAVALARH